MDREAADKPLRFTYHFSAPRVGRIQESDLRVPLSFFPALIGRAYVGVSSRRAALQVAEKPRVALRARVSVPSGLKVESLPKDVRLDTPFGFYLRKVRLEGETIVVEREVYMPQQRVKPGEYAAFVAFASKVDTHDAEEAVLRRR